MTIRLITTLTVLVALAGCASLDERYLIERDDILNENGMHVYSDHQASSWDGSESWQFRAANYGSYPYCVRIELENVRQSNGYAMGYVHHIAPGETKDVGYVNAPALFDIRTRTWDPAPDGSC